MVGRKDRGAKSLRAMAVPDVDLDVHYLDFLGWRNVFLFLIV